MKKRTVAIVQARMGSARFAGKMLAPLGGHPLLEWVLHRAMCALRLDEVVLATTTNPRDDPLAAMARQAGVAVFRGNEPDVLERFAGAAEASSAEWVVRICADNPFVDPRELDRLVEFFAAGDADYACNHLDRLGSRYADGFGAEILGAELLKQVAARATAGGHREHVTSYLWDHADEYRLAAVPAPAELAFPHLRFDVDVPADLARLERLVAAGIGMDSAAAQIVGLAQSALAGAEATR